MSGSEGDMYGAMATPPSPSSDSDSSSSSSSSGPSHASPRERSVDRVPEDVAPVPVRVPEDVAVLPEEPELPPGLNQPDVQGKRDFKRQYLGTWSHTDRVDLKAPESMDRAAFGDMVVASANKVFADNARGGRGGEVNRILKCGATQCDAVSTAWRSFSGARPFFSVSTDGKNKCHNH